jgi:hypothetical protein
MIHQSSTNSSETNREKEQKSKTKTVKARRGCVERKRIMKTFFFYHNKRTSKFYRDYPSCVFSQPLSEFLNHSSESQSIIPGFVMQLFYILFVFKHNKTSIFTCFIHQIFTSDFFKYRKNCVLNLRFSAN